MTVCYIALGGNLGEVAHTFDRALEMLRCEPGVTVNKVSSYHRTAAVGENAGSDFLNGAAEITTELAPLKLLELLQSIEDCLGRTREVRWGPRTIDLDILFYGSQEILNHPKLLIPHPDCWYRRFVLDPLVEIAPDFVHPILHATLREIREKLLQRPLLVGLAAKTESEIQTLERIVSEFSEVEPVKNRTPALYSTAFRNCVLKILFENDRIDILGVQFPDSPKIFNFQHAPVDTFVRQALRAALGQ